jgi:hypothetical protein
MTIPQHTKESLDRYVEHRIPTGGFLRAVLTNDLFGAVSRADQYNVVAIPDIVKYIYNQLPAGCWGSEEIVDRWLNNDG